MSFKRLLSFLPVLIIIWIMLSHIDTSDVSNLKQFFAEYIDKNSQSTDDDLNQIKLHNALVAHRKSRKRHNSLDVPISPEKSNLRHHSEDAPLSSRNLEHHAIDSLQWQGKGNLRQRSVNAPLRQENINLEQHPRYIDSRRPSNKFLILPQNTNRRQSQSFIKPPSSNLIQDLEHHPRFIKNSLEPILQFPKKPATVKPGLNISSQHENHTFSQNGEDGVITALFNHIGVTDKYYVEFGTENGVETNTHRLRSLMGWTGLLMDGGFDIPAINLHREMIYDSNVVGLFQKYNVPMKFDLLSTDTDFKDFWISKAILDAGYRPRVLISEINSSFDKELALTVPREIAQGRWSGTYYYGATPMAMTMLYREYGYSLVYCEKKGINCFWVRNEELSLNDMLKFNDPQHVLSTIRCARYNKNGGAHPTDLNPGNWWQEVVNSLEGKLTVTRFMSSNKGT